LSSQTARIIRSGPTFRAEPWLGPPPAAGWRGVFDVFASDDPAAPPMLGRHAWRGEAVEFTPRFLPSPGVRLRAVFRPEAGREVCERFEAAPAVVRPATRVLSLTPSAPVWPENVLRFYLTFSSPMRIGEAWSHIRLLDETGEPVPGPFVEIDQELWDGEGRRLTVLFDPARIKRGLVDHAAEGLPLVPGRRYTLQIDPAWRDAAGAPLATGLSKAITVRPSVREPIDPLRWTVTPPPTPDAPLIVDFGRCLDAALAPRALAVRMGRIEIAGEAALSALETRYHFQPIQPWASGRYHLTIAAYLEDLAGNRPGRPFDIDTQAAAPEPAVSTLPFRVA
jgi:hypothetical protein